VRPKNWGGGSVHSEKEENPMFRLNKNKNNEKAILWYL